MSDTGNFGVYIATDIANIENSIELIYKELEKLRTIPVSRAELQRTKAQLKGTMMLSLESMSSRMMRLGTGETYFGKYVPLDEIVARMDAVEAGEITDIAQKLFRRENFSSVIIKPIAALTPDEQSVSPAATD